MAGARYFFNSRDSAAMYSGAVPQQPPRMPPPTSAIDAVSRAKSSGPRSKTVRPSSIRGMPALGLAISGMRAKGFIAAISSFIVCGPVEQLQPKASAPRLWSVSRALTASQPVIVRPPGSKVIVTMTGRSQTSRAASSAARASCRSNIVSMMRPETPPATSASICSR